MRSNTATRWVAPVLLAMAASGVSQGFVRFTYPFVLPAMKEDVLPSYGAAGLLGAANLGSYLAGVLVMAALTRRFESSMLVKVGVAMCATGIILIAVAPTIFLLTVGMSIAGLFSAAVWIPASSIVAAHAPPERRGLAFGLLTAGIGLSIGLSGAITAAVQETFSHAAWRQVWAVEGTLTAALLVLLVLRLRPVDSPSGPATAIGPDAMKSRVSARRLYAVYGVYGVSFSLYSSFLIAALQERPEMTATGATRAYSLLGVASVFGGVALGRLSDLTNRRAALGLGMLLTGTCTLAVPFTSDPFLTASVAGYGLLMTGVGTVLIAYLGDLLEPAQVAAVFAAATAALGAAQLVAPPLGGWLADQTGSFVLTYVAAAIAAACAGMVALTLPRPPSSGRSGP